MVREDWAELAFKKPAQEALGSHPESPSWSKMTARLVISLLLPPLPSREKKNLGLEEELLRAGSPVLEGRHPDIHQEQVWPVINHLQMEVASGALGVMEDQPQRKTQKYHIACAEYTPNPSPTQRGWHKPYQAQHSSLC